MRKITLALLLSLYGCGGSGFSPTQADPVNDNQAYMIGEVARIERLMNIGKFIAEFKKPPAATYAGWASCSATKTPPFYIGFNEEYVARPMTEQYMTALVAHEMCHHYVDVKGGNCWDEVAAENCAAKYAR